MILYLDTSALAKLFIDEPGSEMVEAAVGAALAVATHLLAYAEMHATLARAVRMGRVEATDLDRRLREFEERWASLDLVEATDALVRRAGALAVRHGLRGYDSVHLAAALVVHETLGPGVDLRFGASDARLNEAARLGGLSLLELA